MVVHCPNCQKKYNIDSSKITPKVKSGTCKACGHAIPLEYNAGETAHSEKNADEQEPQAIAAIPASSALPAKNAREWWLLGVMGVTTGLFMGLTAGLNLGKNEPEKPLSPVSKHGDSVKIHYTGKLEDGTVFDASEKQKALQFTIGDGQVINGIEKAVLGMRPGESKTVEVLEAFGAYHDDKKLVVKKKDIPDLKLEVGQKVQIRQGDGQTITAVAIELSDDVCKELCAILTVYI
ncbi:MAG: hypothetical protein GY862_39385 [Gammaproteobacteria bacterium]|nr:hypothetical protein [Gammaproteobacteria bacterium]